MNKIDISPHILHKDSEDDVLLKNYQTILPACIHSEYARNAKDIATEEEYVLFNTFYILKGDTYVRRDIPHRIAVDNAKKVNAFDLRIEDFYHLEQGFWVLKAKYIPESICPVARKANGSNNPAIISQKESHIISSLLTRLENGGISKANVYLVKNDTKNYYFYRKTHEHVPGLMLIEVARQAMYHFIYSYYGYSRGSINMSISILESHFSDYAESTYALEVLVTHTQGISVNKPKLHDNTAYFYQNGKRVAQVRIQGGIMSIPLFNRTRKINYPKTHWFSPSNRVLQQAIITSKDGAITTSDLVLISMSAIRLKKNRSLNLTIFSPCYITLHIAKEGFIILPIEKLYDSKETEDDILLKFAQLNKDQKYSLQEIIKCHCVFYKKYNEESSGELEYFYKNIYSDKEASSVS